MPSRRDVLVACAGGVATVAGCVDGPDADTPADTPDGTEPPTTGSTGGDRPTATPRNPRTLDASGAWPQVGSDPGHAGVAAATGVPEVGEAYWHLQRVRSGPPVVADGRLFHFGRVGADETGTPTLTRTPPTGTAQPLDGPEALFCRDARDGRILWTRELDARHAWPVVEGGRVVVAGDGFVAVYRADDGTKVWRDGLGDRSAAVEAAIDGTALVTTEFVRENDRKPDVRAYDVADGTRRWSRPSPKWRADVAASGDRVFALSSQFQVGSALTARSLQDGSERWSVEIDDNGIPGGPVVAGETVYVMPDDEGVYAFDVQDGTERWHYRAETPNLVGLAATGDVAYLVDDGTLRVVDAGNGEERFGTTPEGDREYAGVPAVDDRTIYLEKDGFPSDLVALSRSDGSERWSYTLPETVVEGDMVTSGLAAQPVVVDGGVYAFAEDGLYAFGPA